MNLKSLKFFLVELSDKYVQENFKNLLDFLRADPLRKGDFRFMEIKVTAAGTLRVPHYLKVLPKDIISLSVNPSSASISWKYENFSATDVELSASAPCTVRAYVGSYKETI